MGCPWTSVRDFSCHKQFKQVLEGIFKQMQAMELKQAIILNALLLVIETILNIHHLFLFGVFRYSTINHRFKFLSRLIHEDALHGTLHSMCISFILVH